MPERKELQVSLLPTTTMVRPDGTFDLEKALLLCGQIGGICYSPNGFETLKRESISKTQARIKNTLNYGHHSIYDHINVSLEIKNIPKILAMILNNEKQYTTSEKSARYTEIQPSEHISQTEYELYTKWVPIFVDLTTKKYGEVLKKRKGKINKLALENARYFITVFVPTDLVYTVPLGQLNRIVRWLQDYTKLKNPPFNGDLFPHIKDFCDQIEALGLIEPRLQTNEKARQLSLFMTFEETERFVTNFGTSYSTAYQGSFAQLAQAHRHRTISYSMRIPKIFNTFIPPILSVEKDLVAEWIEDMEKVRYRYPQGQNVLIYEQGTMKHFILKCKERLCSHAQYEIMQQTSETLRAYIEYLGEIDPVMAKYLKEYSKGAKCSFPDYQCLQPCGFPDGIDLTRLV